MKFIAGQDAPDIPRELLEAQENDNLILFCGAGISYPAGLPLFGGLVNEVYDELATTPTNQEENAIKQWRYDTALELLERRFHAENRADKHLVRKAIATRLTLKDDANLDTHKAILQLAKTKQQKYRLVTTNVDRGFILADPASLAVTDAAPKLPVPKPHKWQSIVYLHGLIDKTIDPDSEHLIFTSGDFGTAYLTERWASRFVSELFRHFTVLFVGYSIDDPVMRYMTDAIAADRRRGYTHSKQPYVLAGTPKNKFEQAKDDWEAKGVIPILYNQRNKHLYLHNTLKEWAAYCRDGFDSIERLIKIHARKPPLPPYEHNDSVQMVIESLKKDDKENYAATIFLKVAPPIGWLPLLEAEGLLAKMANKHQHNITHHLSYDLIKPNEVTFTLWRWLVDHHIESRGFVEWIIDKGNSLHPTLIKLIKEKLQNKPPNEPFLTFWRSTVLNNYHNVFIDAHHEIKNIKSSRNSLLFSPLIKLLEPIIKFSKPFSWDGNEPTKLFEATIVIEMTGYIIKELNRHTNKITTWLLPISNALKQTMEYWQLLGQADEKNDLSVLYLPSISPHQQNHNHHNWTFLIELCRDLWAETFQTNNAHALAILELWKTIPFPVFKRLVLHAYATSECATSSEKLNYLLTDNHWWLWSTATKREKFRLFESLSPQLSGDQLTTLENAIITGPPRSMYREKLSDQEWQERSERQVWLHLAKLESFSVNLSKNAKTIYKSLSAKYPQRELDGDRDEFNTWFSTGRRNSCDFTIAEFIKLSIEQRIEKLSDSSSYYISGRLALFTAICKDKPDIALETLNFLSTHTNWNTSIWHAGIYGLSDTDTDTDTDKPLWIEIAKLIVLLPNEFFKTEAWVISWWIKNTIKSIKEDSEDEKYFWQLFDLLVANAQPIKIEEDIYHQVINHPIGILTEAFLNRFAIREIKAKETITNDNLLSRLNTLVNNKHDALLIARVILFSRLDYLYAIDPKWSQNNLIPLLDWKLSSEAAFLWLGYLWSPQISADLALILKEHLLTTLISHAQELGKATAVAFELFVAICFEYKNIYSVTEQRTVLNKIGKESLKGIAQYIERSLSEGTHQKDQYWKNRIKPFFMNAWPRDAKSLDPEISQSFALMCIALGEEFEQAVESIKNILTHFDIQSLLGELKETPHIEKHPCTTFDLLATVFDTQAEQCWFIDDLKEVMTSLEENCPDLKNDPRFITIEQFLKKNSNV